MITTSTSTTAAAMNNNNTYRNTSSSIRSRDAGKQLLDALSSSSSYTTTSNNNGYDQEGAGQRQRERTLSLSYLRSLIATTPSLLVKTRDDRGRCALHVACELCGSDYDSSQSSLLEVIQYLVETWPPAVRVRDDDGWLPLHYAATTTSLSLQQRQRQQLDIVQYLIQQWPESITQKTNCGMLPLHLACSSSSSFLANLDMIMYLVETWPESLQITNDLGQVPLHKLCECRGGLAAGTSTTTTITTSTFMSVLQYMVQMCPRSVQAVNDLGEVPLHNLLMSSSMNMHPNMTTTSNSSSFLAQVQFLIKVWPASVQARTNDGEVALHVACSQQQHQQRGVVSLLDVIQYVLDQWPEAVRTTTNSGNLPIHLACANGASLDVVRYLVEQWPDSVRVENNDGKTPLDLARRPFAFRRIQPSVVKWLDLVITNGTITKVAVGSNEDDVEKQQHLHAKHRASSSKQRRRQSSSRAKSFDRERNHLLQVISGERDEPVSVHTRYVETLIKGGQDEVLGTGNFGVVVKGVDEVIVQEFAIKAIQSDALAGVGSEALEQVKEEFKQEQQALLRVRHPNIALLYAYALSAHHHHRRHYLLYELAEKGSLDKFWSNDLGRSRLSSFSRRAQIALDIIVGLRFLHVGNSSVRPSFHRDVKSANIVLKRNMTAQLIDCGMGSLFASTHANAQNVETSASATGTLGYMCPKYCSGYIPFEASCDMFSFGVVLAELWSGRLQNHRDLDGRVHNFYDEYIDADVPCSMKHDLDAALGFDNNAELPWYMSRFKNLALRCMSSSPQKRPYSADALNRLENIWNASIRQDEGQVDTMYEDDFDSLNESLQFVSPEEVDDDSVCRVCRTYAVEVGFDECQLCLALQRQRLEIAGAVPIQLDAVHTAPAVQEYTAMRSESARHVSAMEQTPPLSDPLLPIQDMRLNHSIPRLFVIVPANQAMSGHEAQGLDASCWLESKNLAVPTKFQLYFICQHTLQAVSPPIHLTASKVWLEHIALLLAVSLTVLEQCHANTSLQLNEQCSIDQQDLAELLISVKRMLSTTSDNDSNNGALDLIQRVKSGSNFTEEDIRRLNGSAYELLAERARQDLRWRKAIVPVRKLFGIQVYWVSCSVADDLDNKYEGIDVLEDESI